MSEVNVVDKGLPPLGRKLASRRVLLGISAKDAAAKVGITRVHLSRIENSDRPASLRVLHGLAQLYGTTVDELLRDTDLAAVA